MFSLAITAPVLSLLRENVEFFVARQLQASDYVLFAVLLAVLAPAALALLVVLVRPRWARTGVGILVVGCLACALAFQVVRAIPNQSEWSGALQIAFGLGVGLVGLVMLLRWAPMRTFLRAGLALPFVLIGFFFLAGPVRAGMGAMHVESADITITNPVPVVFLIFDELPVLSLMQSNGELNEERFPNFARLAEHTTWFRNAFANSPSTTRSVPSILTGRFPDGDGLSSIPVAANHPQNLFTLVGQGYTVSAEESVTMLCPDEICGGRPPFDTRWRSLPADTWYVLAHLTLPEALTGGLPPIDETWADFGTGSSASESAATTRVAADSDRARSFDRFLEAIDSDAPQTLYFHHALVPHRPWQYLPSGQSYEAHPRVPGTDRSIWADNQYLVDQGYQRHMLQVGFADALVGKLLDRLEKVGLLESAVIVVTADHGIGFEPGRPMRGQLDESLGDVGPVPLFVSVDDSRDGEIVDTPVELVDILPTVAAALQAEVDWPFDGDPLQAIATSGEEAVVRTFPGPVIHPDPERSRVEALKNLADRYDLDGGWGQLLKSESGLGLVGRSPESVGVGDPLGWTVYLQRLDIFDHVDLEGATLPIVVEGHISNADDGSGPIRLALALNGSIATVLDTFDQATANMISVVVPVHALQEGFNRVTLYSIEGQGSRLLLRPITDIRPAE